MKLSDTQFQMILSQVQIQTDPFLGIFGLVAKHDELLFEVFYCEDDIIKNQYVINKKKMDLNIFSEKDNQEINLTQDQLKTLSLKLKDVYENEYLEAKDEYENPKIQSCNYHYRREMDLMTSDWYSLTI